jgi:anaerobic magnesium-protoporphyrin IX monomethyl ester cyclase
MLESMKILLINPPLTREEAAGKLGGITNLLPPLGIGFIAAVLEKEGFPVKIIDCPPLNLTHSDLQAIIKAEGPQLIGFTDTVLSHHSAVAAARNAREASPRSLIVIGGPFSTALPEETMLGGPFDVAVLGEGEYSFLEIARQMRDASRDFSGISGLMYRKDGELVFTGPRPYISDLDSLPFPAIHLFPPLSLYHPMPGNVKRIPYVQMMTSRGCPYQCTFCDRKVFGQLFRARSPVNVVDEIETLMQRFGVKEVKFNDDTFNIDPQRVTDICERMLKKNIRVPWTCRVRVHNLSRGLLKTMKRAGCWQIGFGIESADPRMLKEIKKSISPEEGREAARLAKECGINVKVSFMLGLPGETRETIKKTISFAKTIPADVVNFHIFIPYPGSELFKTISESGKLLHKNYQHYCQLNLPENMRLPFVPEGLTDDEIRRSSREAHRSFYLRPAYIWSQFRQIRSLLDIYRYWQGFLAVLGL